MTRQKNKRGDISNWDQTGSPEIPDKGETSEMPCLLSGAENNKCLIIFQINDSSNAQ